MSDFNVRGAKLRSASKHYANRNTYWRASVKAYLPANSKWLYASHGENLFFEWFIGGP